MKVEHHHWAAFEIQAISVFLSACLQIVFIPDSNFKKPGAFSFKINTKVDQFCLSACLQIYCFLDSEVGNSLIDFKLDMEVVYHHSLSISLAVHNVFKKESYGTISTYLHVDSVCNAACYCHTQAT